MIHSPPMLLLDLLVNQGKLVEAEAKALELDLIDHPDGIIDQKLIDKNIPEEQLLQIRSTLYGLPIYKKEVIQDKVLTKLVSSIQSKQLLAVPLEMKDEVLSIGVVDPDYGNVIDALQFMFGPSHRAYKVYLISYSQFKSYMTGAKVIKHVEPEAPKKVAQTIGTSPVISPKTLEPTGSVTPPTSELVVEKKTEKTLQEAVAEKAETEAKTENEDKTKEEEIKPEVIEEIKPIDPRKEVEEGVNSEDMVDLSAVSGVLDDALLEESIPIIFNSIVRHALDQLASDIHIEDMGEKVRVRFRVDGSLETGLVMPGTLHQTLVARIKILSNMKLDEKRKPQDGRFSTRLGDHKIDYRVSTFPGYYGEKVVIRILDSYRGVRPLSSVELSPENLSQIRAALARPYGIILVSGPTGSGKTTTLYSMLGEIDKEHRNVVSLEDPIEYNLPSINQSQVFPEIGYTFASGLRSILRQDPDVIMVGEIRDAETAGLAIQAALTGHLVFSTIHTNTAIGVVTRLLDMGIEPYLIAPTLNLAIGQRLAKSIAPNCESPLPRDPATLALIEEEFKDLDEVYRNKIDLTKPFHEAKPSKEFPTGMKGRVPVFEVLTVDDDIQNAILNNKGEEEITRLARSKGMTMMKEDAMIKCMNGRIPFTEINDL